MAMKKRKKYGKILIFSLLTATFMAVSATAVSAASAPGISNIALDSAMVKGGIRGRAVGFTTDDFRRALGVSRIKAITLDTLPDASSGILTLGSTRVSAGQTIPAKNISMLAFIPATDTVESAAFTFSVGSQCAGCSITCDIRLCEKINFAPTAGTPSGELITVSTHKNISVFGTLGGSDPEGDETELIIVAYPKRGTLTITDRKSGEYRYTPGLNYTGRDSFTYVLRDYYGNYSKPETVIVSVKRNTSGLVYADMADSRAYNSALMLAEKNIMLGSLVGDGMYFSPEGKVTRAEFVVMAMKAAGISPLSSGAKTFFDDDSIIPQAMKGYVAAAQRCGYVVGSFNGKGLYFSPNDYITGGEAAVIVNRMLSITPSGEAQTSLSDESVPSWELLSVSALADAGIYQRDESGMLAVSEPLSRARAAMMLCAVCEKSGK